MRSLLVHVLDEGDSDQSHEEASRIEGATRFLLSFALGVETGADEFGGRGETE